MAIAIERVLAEPELRSELITQGLANIKRFSWKKTARETLKVLEMAAIRLASGRHTFEYGRAPCSPFHDSV